MKVKLCCKHVSFSLNSLYPQILAKEYFPILSFPSVGNGEDYIIKEKQETSFVVIVVFAKARF